MTLIDIDLYDGNCDYCKNHRNGSCNTWCDSGEAFALDITKIKREKQTSTNYEMIQQKTIDELAEWLHDYGDFEDTPWQKWWVENHCDKCESIKGKFVDTGKEMELCYCELEHKCRFYPEMEKEPSLREMIKMWLNAKTEN